MFIFHCISLSFIPLQYAVIGRCRKYFFATRPSPRYAAAAIAFSWYRYVRRLLHTIDARGVVAHIYTDTDRMIFTGLLRIATPISH